MNNPPRISTSPDRVFTTIDPGLRRIGTLCQPGIAPRPAHNLPARPFRPCGLWTLGCETLDRDFADWDQYRDYLAPLGLHSIRLQGGWAKTERTRGVYDFAWIDHIVDDALSLGLSPILETGYGNPIYPGGGGFDLGCGFPTSAEGLAAWDAWVDAFSRHFAGRVRDWFMWNEPDIAPSDGSAPKTPVQIAAFNIRTARIVKKNIPDARIAGLSLARNRPEFLEECLRALGDDVSLFDWFVYHGYQYAPEASYENVEAQKEVVARLAPHARLRQGENGAPSEMTSFFALKRKAWSEISQAKWNLRRMIGDIGHGVESSIFTICDFNHIGREINRKGLLRADEDHRVIAVKRAYYAVQNLASVFGGDFAVDDISRGGAENAEHENLSANLRASASLRENNSPFLQPTSLRSVDLSLSAYAFSSGDVFASGGGAAPRPRKRIFAFWTHGSDFVDPSLVANAPGLHAPAPDERILPFERPGDSFETRPAVFEDCADEPLHDPVWVDLLSGRVYDFPAERVVKCDSCIRYIDVPAYDSPCLLAEREAIDFK
ncbi:MAG: hypothetical protein IJ783_07050 [Kiritimatiellae bacterium]|nr:hypothetical protein [Kiritimatiellia bacterium]